MDTVLGAGNARSVGRPQALWEAPGVLAFETDEAGLPVCRLVGGRPFYYPPNTPAPKGMAETDPWFILGNYGLTVFPHASGSYQLLHTERGFVRLNHDGSAGVTGRACRSEVEWNDRVSKLLDVAADEKLFGCGWAEWTYRLDALEIRRRLDVLPSGSSTDRIPAMRLTVTIRNTGDAPVELCFTEGLAARYHSANWNNPPAGRRLARYPVSTESSRHGCKATFNPQALRGLVFDTPDRLAQADGQPINVHLEIVEGDAEAHVERIDEESCWLLARSRGALQPEGETTLSLLVGWSDESLAWEPARERMSIPLSEMRKAWAGRLPGFASADPAERAEMQWHTHTLYAMASWDQRYRCTFIPQGTLYEYGVGVAACTRDHAMHALPACHFDPDLALSVLEYLARHTDLRGQIQHTDEGAGQFPVGGDQKSDNQLFALLLAVEYLEQTGDARCLSRAQMWFPCGTPATGTLLDRIARWVRYLRDCIHVGRHGLVRIMLSDISDTLHSAFPHLPYSHVSYHAVFNGESYVNTGIALEVLRRLAKWLEGNLDATGVQRPLAVELRDACRQYEQQLREALFRDLEGRPWCPRGRVDDHVLGADESFSASQAFIFSNPDLPMQRRLGIWRDVKPGLWDGEHFGVRLREGEGKHRCGMIWYAWTGLFGLGLAAIDPAAAREALDRLSLRRRARIAPDQWVGLWSNSDMTWAYHGAPPANIPGTTRVGYVGRFPHYCAHVHAWPLMLWFALQSKEGV